jgi:radical SAM protein with 4Fe4S-binding SPASM domain
MNSGHSCFKNKICVTSTYDVYPCIMERSFTYGNILEKPLSEILKNGKPFMSASKDAINTCKDCEYRYACFDCRVIRESGDGFFAKPSNCGYNPHTGIWVD